MSDPREFLHTACPSCKEKFEYPADSYGDTQPFPHCGSSVRLVPRPMLMRREFFLLVNGEAKGPFSFVQISEMFKSGGLTLDSICRVLPGGEWIAARELRLDASDAFNVNEIPVYVKRPMLSYPLGPYSFLELQKEIEAGRVTPECQFWWPTVGFWIDFKVLQMALASETNPELAEKLGRSIRNDNQYEPPPFSAIKYSTSVNADSFADSCGGFLGLFMLVIIVLFMLKGCS